MCNQHHRHSIHCILPPHILQNIANKSPDATLRAFAVKTLSMDHTLRSLRTAPATIPSAKPGVAHFKPEGTLSRAIYSSGEKQELPGVLVRAENQPASGDIEINEAYDGLGSTFKFYWDIFARDSIDDNGLPLTASVHFGASYDNAFWNGSQMVFGDGDGQLFQRFTISLDVIGHELTHGVTEHEAKLAYFGQSGALNESISDVFGSLIKQYELKQTAQSADWLIGAGLLAKTVKGVALRSMKDPGSAYDDAVLGKDPQPKHMKDFVHTFDDNGGVHVNSGIPNHAFYLVATALGGKSWDQAGKIWYETLRDPRLKPGTGFRRFADLTALVAGRLYGTNSKEQKAVYDAWGAVGIGKA